MKKDFNRTEFLKRLASNPPVVKKKKKSSIPFYTAALLTKAGSQ